MPEQVQIRFQLANRLAMTGDSSKLYLQIQEMKNSGVNQIAIDYFMAFYHVNRNEFSSARWILAALQPLVAHNPEFKARVNVLLAKCYGELNEPELQWDATQRAVAANPNDLQARLDWIQGMINRGDLTGAIEQYRRIVAQVPQVRLALVRLLLAWNRRVSKDQRDWKEVEQLLGEAAKAAPGSAEPVVLQAIVFAEQEQVAKARDALQTARSQFPKAVDPWIAEAQLLAQEKKFDEALKVMVSAQKTLGDQIEFRYLRAWLWVEKGGQEALAALNSLGDNLESFPKESRRRLLATLATDLGRQEDLEGASPDVVAAGRAESRGSRSSPPPLRSGDPGGRQGEGHAADRGRQGEDHATDRGHREDRSHTRQLLPGGLPDLASGPQPGQG